MQSVKIIIDDLMDEWYRRETWTETDEAEFQAKLKRARKSSRAQYLLIQAASLVSTKKPALLNVAEELLNKILKEYPDERIWQSNILNQLGKIYELQNEIDQAINYYLQAVEFEKIYPNVLTLAYIDLSLLVLYYEKYEYYEILIPLIEQRIVGELFPSTKYRAFSALSILYKKFENHIQSNIYADLAEQNATSETSGLRYHKDLGVVKNRIEWLDEMVRKV